MSSPRPILRASFVDAESVAGARRMVTVVTVTLNNLEGLRRTFASLAAQDLRDVQHVIIDGASTDGTREWLPTAAVLDDTIIISEPDEGVYDAMNKGARLAEGLLVNFMNAGDAYADPRVLSRAVASFDRERWDWAFGLARMVDAEGAAIRPVRPYRYSMRRHALGSIAVSHQATFMRTAFFRELGGFDTRYRLAGDTELLVRAGLRAAPTVWRSIDVLCQSGGISDANAFAQVFERHRVRMSIPEAALRPWLADLIWTCYQATAIGLRKMGKRALQVATRGRFTTWWAARGL